MGYIESTLSGDEKVEYKFSYHWIKWVIPVILFIFGFISFVFSFLLNKRAGEEVLIKESFLNPCLKDCLRESSLSQNIIL